MLKKIKKNVLISLSAGGLLYLGFTIYANIDNVLSAFESFHWLILPLVLLLSIGNYIFRFFKWDYYLSVIGVKIKKIDSFSIFMSGLLMSVTPGKMGELLKSYLVKEVTGTAMSKTFPVIFVERITDFISLILITLIGAYVFKFGKEIIIGVGIFYVMLLVIISNRKISLYVIEILGKIKFLKKHMESIHNAYESSYLMLRPWPLFYSTVISIISWSFECLGYHIILVNFNIEVSFLWAAFSYGFATIIGAITMLPGGLGVTEGSLTFMLVRNNFPKDLAVASTFVIRIVTLWFALLIGILSVTFYQNRYGKITVETVSN